MTKTALNKLRDTMTDQFSLNVSSLTARDYRYILSEMVDFMNSHLEALNEEEDENGGY